MAYIHFLSVSDLDEIIASLLQLTRSVTCCVSFLSNLCICVDMFSHFAVDCVPVFLPKIWCRLCDCSGN